MNEISMVVAVHEVVSRQLSSLFSSVVRKNTSRTYHHPLLFLTVTLGNLEATIKSFLIVPPRKCVRPFFSCNPS